MIKTLAAIAICLTAFKAGVASAQSSTIKQTSAQSALPRRNIPAIAKAANGCVVSIVMSDKDGKPLAQGSGFLVSTDGVIVTNYHVIAEGSSAVIKFPDGAFYVVDGVLSSDKVRDIAVIKAHGQNFKTLALGNSDRVQVGDEVVAIGNPLSLESTVSNGIVSGIRTVEEGGANYLQITAPISPGSSGGPLFNMEGKVIGITTMYLKGGENLNFAIPIDDAKRLLSSRSTKMKDLPDESDSTPAVSDDLELNETMNWIVNSFEENHKSVRDGYVRYTTIVSPLSATAPGEGRNLTIYTFVRPSASLQFVIEHEAWFNLRDIDPNTVSFRKQSEGEFVFTARTRNDELKIEDRSLKENVSSITFDLDPDYGPRFIKAFKHAVILAGGKPSIF